MDSGAVNSFGQAKIASSGTAQQLPLHSSVNGFILTAKSTNTNPIVVGDASVTNTVDGTGNGYILEPGASVSTAKLALKDIYIIGSSGDVISFAAA